MGAGETKGMRICLFEPLTRSLEVWTVSGGISILNYILMIRTFGVRG